MLLQRSPETEQTNANLSPAKPNECRHVLELSNSARDSKGLKYAILGTIGTGLALAAFFFVVIVAVIARFVATDKAGVQFEPDNPEFVLYKNSRFKECYDLTPDPGNCSSIFSGLSTHARNVPEGFGYLSNVQGWKPESSSDRATHPPIYDWCQIVSCFNGFKIVPSTPRPSATLLSDIVCWWSVMMTSASALVHTGKQYRTAFRKEGTPCRGRKDLSVLDYIFFVYDICGPIFWWWVSFVMFAVNPAMSTTIAITAWVTSWKLGSVLKFHPYSCALPGGPRIKRILPWILNAVALLQWIAGIYVISVYLGDLSGNGSTLQSYDCLASQIPDAPGSTSCSAQDLCSKTPLFRTGARFMYEDTFYVQGRYNLMAYFWIWTLMALMPFIFLFIAWCGKVITRSSAEVWRKDAKFTWRSFNRGPSLYLGIASIISLAYGVGYGVHLIQTWDSTRDREGPFTFHAGCNALHVPLSPWRDYLDLGAYERAFRIAKMVFNA